MNTPINILLVDDRPSNLLALRATLEPLDETLLEAGSGEAALALAAQHDLAVVVLDVQMPGMDGFEVAARLRALTPHRCPPILFITAGPVDAPLLLRGYALGAVGFLPKPFAPELLRAKVAVYAATFRQTRALETSLQQMIPAADGLRILLVNDNPAGLTSLNAALEELEAEVSTARSAQEAIGLLLQQEFSLILLDFNMPVMDGPELVQLIRTNDRFRYIPIVFVTATAQAAQNIEAGYAVGVTDYIFLPISPELLRVRVRAILNQFAHQRRLQRELREVERLNLALKDSKNELQQLNATLEQRVLEQTVNLREQAELLDHAPDAIVVCDLQGRCLFWNKGAEHLYGWLAAEALGRTPADLGFAADPAAMKKAMRTVHDQGEWQGELLLNTKAGATLTAQVHYKLVLRADGAPKSIIAIGTDVTEKKKLEAQFLRAQRLENLGQLAGGIAHDLNNILAPILMAAPMLREQIQDPDLAHMVGTIETSAQRGADVVKQILTFARGLAGETVVIQPRHLLDEMARIIRETFSKNISLKSSTTRDLWPVLGDATQLHQVLLNLCINARDAMPEGGALTLSAENTQFDETSAITMPGARPGDYVQLRVRDSGTGIPPEILERIFDPFFTTKEQGRGTGLGLSTVLGLVKGHGGFVQVDSKLGRGTEFRIYLPATTHELPPATVADALPQGRGELILVVDDEAPLRQTVKAVLQRNGYRVLLAANGVEAIALYVEHRDIHLVLTDLMMPIMNGVTTLCSLRQINPQLKAIVATGLTDEIQEKAIYAAGALGILHKPFSLGALLGALRTALDNPPAIPAED